MSSACSSSSDSNPTGGGNGGSGATAAGSGFGASSSGGGFNTGTGSSTGAAGASGGGNGTQEICNGIDDDGNGIIDDVDVGGDGVCDCIRIATLGIKGTWGEGDVFHSWLDGKATNGVVDLADQTLTDSLLAQYQIIVVQDVSKGDGIKRDYTDDEVAALLRWVKAGGGLMTLIGYHSPDERSNVNLILSEFSMNYGEQQILQKNGDTTHPVTGWVDSPVSTDVTALGVDNGYPVNGGTVFATESGYNVGAYTTSESGRIVVWGDEWITYNSEWVEHTDYQVARFWLNVIKYLSPPKECQVPIPDDVH